MLDINKLTAGQINRADPRSPSWEGTGIFDKLMEAVSSNIAIQFEANRLIGPEYANVYLGSIQYVLSTSMSLLVEDAKLEMASEIQKEQIKLMYVERIAKDKEASKLGLDNVVKTSNASPENIYTPKYVGQ
mgnify:CR=1 FL=1